MEIPVWRQLVQAMLVAPAAAAAVILAAPSATRAQPCSETPTALTANSGSGGCSQCANTRLPGGVAVSAETSYTILSDLPETFCTSGVLYSTSPVLPPDVDGNIPLSLRTQTNTGFGFIDGPFDMFLFHNVYNCTPASADKRLVVLAKNDGASTVTVTGKQILISDGIIGNVHQLESSIGTRELAETWDSPVGAVAIAPGDTQVVAYSKRFASGVNNSDRSSGVNCFGRVRAAVANPLAPGTPTRLTVTVVGIDGGAASLNLSRALAASTFSARSGETSIDLSTPPAGCDIRRATGVYPTFLWRTAPGLTLDAAAIAPGGVKFQMAAWGLVSSACAGQDQSRDMLLYPGYARDDTVGNYHVDYRTRFRVINRDTLSTRTVDLGFGKADADIGLAWQTLVTPDGSPLPTDAALMARPARTGWAGPNQTSASRSLLEFDDGVLTLGPCSAVTVDVRLMVLGNASLPFTLNATVPDPGGLIVDNTDATTSRTSGWGSSANPGFYGTNSLVKAAGSGTARTAWFGNLPGTGTGRYAVYAWWVASANRAAAAPYRVSTRTGLVATPVDQRSNGSSWRLLGTFSMDAGPNKAYVDLSDAAGAGEFVSADAVRWVYLGPDLLPVSVSAFGAE